MAALRSPYEMVKKLFVRRSQPFVRVFVTKALHTSCIHVYVLLLFVQRQSLVILGFQIPDDSLSFLCVQTTLNDCSAVRKIKISNYDFI